MPDPTRKVGRIPKYARNQTDLGRYLIPPRDRKIIQLAMRRPGNPGRTPDGKYEILPWQTFVNSHFGSDYSEVGPDKTKLEQEKLRLTNEKLRFQLSVMQREYSRNTDIEAWFGAAVGRAKHLLLKMPSSLAPVVVGMDPVEAEKRIQEEVDAALNELTARPLHEGSENAGPIIPDAAETHSAPEQLVAPTP